MKVLEGVLEYLEDVGNDMEDLNIIAYIIWSALTTPVVLLIIPIYCILDKREETK